MELDREGKGLSVRLHPQSFETQDILAFDPEAKTVKGFASLTKKKRAEKMLWNGSVASCVLKVAGVLETKNPKMLAMRENYKFFAKCIQTPRDDHTEDEWKHLKYDSKKCAKEIVRTADFLFATCITAGSKWAREFRHECVVVFLDETGSVTEAEALIVWKGDKPLVIAGDS